MQLSMTGSTPGKIAAYLNTLAKEYLIYNLKTKNQQAINSISFIDSQLAILEDSLRQTEKLLNQAKSQLPISQSDDISSTLTSDYRNLTDKELKLELRKSYITQILSQIDSTQLVPIYLSSELSAQSEQLQKLITQLNQLSLEILSAKRVERKASINLQRLQKKHSGAVAIIKDYLTKSLKNTTIELKQIKEKSKRLESELSLLPNYQRDIVRIERKLAIHDQMYAFLMEKKAELGIRRSASTPDYAILEPCYPADADLIAPNVQQYYLIGSLLGLFIPGIILLLVRLLNKKITDLYDLRHLSTIPILGHLSHNKYEDEIPVTIHRKSKFAESFRTLKANLQFILNGSSRKVVAITSSVSGEGKTFCAVNLAAVMAQARERTLLIGLDLRKPRLYKICQLNNRTGLSTYLNGQSDRTEIIQPTNIPNLDIVVAGPVPPNPAELMESERLVEFMTYARKHYDNILVDTPPVALVADVILLRKLFDVTLYVVRFNYSHKDVLHLVQELTEKGIFKLTLVVNDIVDTKNYNYHRKYSYGYYGARDNGYYEDRNEAQKKGFLSKFGIHR